MTTLVGRDRQLGQLKTLLADSPAGGGSVALVGTPGIGKSALLEEAVRSASQRGWQSLATSGALAEMRLPFAGIHKLLRPWISELGRLAPDQENALACALGIIDAPTPQIYSVAQATLELLVELAVDQPVVLGVDDTQWLDQASAEVLAFVARRLSSDPIALIATGHLGGGDIVVDACERTIVLDPLDEHLAAELLNASPVPIDEQTRRAVLEAAAGHPLALVELPKALSAADETGGSRGWIPMTERLERAFVGRAAQLGGGGSDILLLAAVNDGDRLEDLLRAATLQLGRPVTAADLAPAVDAGLLEVRDAAVRFRHPLMRSAIYQAADLQLRQHSHAVLARTLEDEPDRRAWHRAQATLGVDESVAAELEAAAIRAQRRGAVADAVAAWERSAGHTAPSPRRTGRLLRAAELATDLGDAWISARLSEQLGACELSRRDELRYEWVRERGDAGMQGGPARIEVLLGLADDADADGDPELALRFLVNAGLRCWSAGVSEETSTQVVQACDRLGRGRVDPRLTVSRAYAAPLVSAEQILALLSPGSGAVPSEPADQHLLGHAAACVGAFGRAQELLSAATEGLRMDGRLSLLAHALRLLAWSSLRCGRWDVAASAAEESQRLAIETRQPLVEADSMTAQALLAANRSELNEADELVTRAEGLTQRSASSISLALIQIAKAAAAAARDDPERAFGELDRIYHPRDRTFHHMQACWSLGSLTEFAVTSGHEREARSRLASLAPTAVRSPAEGVQVSLRYAEALLASDDAAETSFEAALDPAFTESRFEIARVRLSYGTWLRRGRRISDARDALRDARDAFDVLGAVGWADRAQRELGAAGERSSRRAPEAWDQLTPQELQIARMVAQGLSNKEIGQRLYLSHRTVASHLYRMFPKLGVSSRTQLAQSISMGLTSPAES